MKKRSTRSGNGSAKIACTVSAAALMLGVSQAATVGFHFQANYCGTPSYSGAIVTAPAFGISTNSWENLLQMDTGYGNCSVSPPAYYTLNEVIDTTAASATNGLNRLPAGSLNVTWSASSANVSGFGGYDRSPPHYTFGGNGYHPGNEQVYWAFLRDGVNFGPGQSGGDNNQPGYNVDITGLKSLFGTNSFVVQLIASSDSLAALTNAFVIDATLNSTQSVSYPNIAPFNPQGSAPWQRGIGGGLSTSSGALSTDHLQIAGNQAQHGAPTAGAPDGFDNASTICGFILTDKPVVTMSPQSVLATPGDTVTLRAIAIGVPPLAYQWSNGGQLIPGATNSAYVITNTRSGSIGSYQLAVTNRYGSALSDTSSVTYNSLSEGPLAFTLDSKPAGAALDAENLGAAWLASKADILGTNRAGVMQFVATNAPSHIYSVDGIVLPGTTTNFDYTTGTISFWMLSSGTVTNSPGTNGATLFDRFAGNGLLVVQNDDGTILVQPSGSGNSFTSTKTISDGKWHQIAVTYDQSSTGSVALYIDGVQDSQQPNTTSWSWPAGQEIELGDSHNFAWENYNGFMDDFRIYNRQLTGDEVHSVYASDALVDTNSLQVRLNFSAPNSPGLNTDITNAVNPFPVRAAAATQFFRYRHTPVALKSNPYDM